MAIVNIDLSEYDSLRNRKKELEERVKELEEQVKGLKNSSKVIVRTIEPTKVCSRTPWGGYSEDREFNYVSESFVNFEDVRLKVEEHMKEDIQASIAFHKMEADKYRKMCEDFEETKGKEYKELTGKLNEEYRAVSEKLSRVSKMHDTAFNKIHALAERVLLDLEDRLFRPNESIRLVKEIEDVSFKHEI